MATTEEKIDVLYRAHLRKRWRALAKRKSAFWFGVRFGYVHGHPVPRKIIEEAESEITKEEAELAALET